MRVHAETCVTGLDLRGGWVPCSVVSLLSGRLWGGVGVHGVAFGVSRGDVTFHYNSKHLSLSSELAINSDYHILSVMTLCTSSEIVYLAGSRGDI
ncbi:hypothetical protein ACQP1W_02900 [Spirillospora sp. CA-255316]